VTVFLGGGNKARKTKEEIKERGVVGDGLSLQRHSKVLLSTQHGKESVRVTHVLPAAEKKARRGERFHYRRPPPPIPSLFSLSSPSAPEREKAS
jgi:hypothetical protein